MSKAKFAEGEKVLCFHGPLLYEAKCLQVDVKDGQLKYFVHYQGWNKNWDEWVTDARMMKFNAVGLQKQKELKELYSKSSRKMRKSELKKQSYPMPEALRKLEEKAAAAAAVAEAPDAGVGEVEEAGVSAEAASATDAVAVDQAEATQPTQQQQQRQQQQQQRRRRRRRRRQLEAPKRLRLRLSLPTPLRLWLADDADFVNVQYKLLRLPAPPGANVQSIVASFLEDVVVVGGGGEGEGDAGEWRDFADGLVSLFNSVLGSQLLYKFERPQYAELLRQHRSQLPAAVYGCPHLLRLLARLHQLLPAARVDAASAERLLRLCDVFVLFLERRYDSLVTPDNYEVSTPQYQRLALCA